MWIKDQYVGPEIINYIENIDYTFESLTPTPREIKAKIRKQD